MLFQHSSGCSPGLKMFGSNKSASFWLFKNAGKAISVVSSQCNSCPLNPFFLYLGHILPFLSSDSPQLILSLGHLIIPLAFDPWMFPPVHVLGHVWVLFLFIYFSPLPTQSSQYAFLLHQCLSIDSPLPGKLCHTIIWVMEEQMQRPSWFSSHILWWCVISLTRHLLPGDWLTSLIFVLLQRELILPLIYHKIES